MCKGMRVNVTSASKLTDDRQRAHWHGPRGVHEVPLGSLPAEARLVASREGGLCAWHDGADEAHATMETKPSDPLVALHRRGAHFSTRRFLMGLKRKTTVHPELLRYTEKQLRAHMKEFPPCRGCCLGKATRVSGRTQRNPQTSPDALRLGECWEADTCFPIRPVGCDGSNGFMLLRESKSGMLFDASVVHKSDSALAMLEILRAVAPTLPKLPDHATMRVVRVDDGEINSNWARSELAQIGFQLDVGAPLHRNSIPLVDRAMRLVEDGVRTLVNAAEAPPAEHPHARKHFVRVHNVTPQESLGWRTPHQMFHGKVPDLSRLRPWCSPVLVTMMHGTERVKSERTAPAACIGFYLGTPTHNRGHLVRIPGKKEPAVRHNVRFFEDATPTTKLKPLPPSQRQPLVFRVPTEPEPTVSDQGEWSPALWSVRPGGERQEDHVRAVDEAREKVRAEMEQKASGMAEVEEKNVPPMGSKRQNRGVPP